MLNTRKMLIFDRTGKPVHPAWQWFLLLLKMLRMWIGQNWCETESYFYCSV